MTRRIVSTPDTCSGSPRIEGTRLTCANVVVPLGMHNMPLSDYLSEYPNLQREDIEECVRYCAAQNCLDDHVPAFCQGCSLDTRVTEKYEIPNPPINAPEVISTTDYEDESFNVWEIAHTLLQRLTEEQTGGDETADSFR